MTANFDVPANAARIVVYLGLQNCTGSVWFSGVRLTPLFDLGGPATDTNLVANGDFESFAASWALPSAAAVLHEDDRAEAAISSIVKAAKASKP